MKPGDLRRFSDRLTGSPRTVAVVGRPFMVLEASSTQVSFLVDGRIERGWGSDWVIENSEVLDASCASAG